VDGISELASMLKKRDNPSYLGITIGKIITPPPNTKIQLNEKVILENDRLIFSAHVLNGYKRQFQSQSSGEIITKTPPSPISYSNYTVLESLANNGELTLTDTLKVGDEVILVPTSNEQKYFVLDKAVML